MRNTTTCNTIEIEAPSVEVCIGNGLDGPEYNEFCTDADEETLAKAIEKLIDRHYDELVDLCTDVVAWNRAEDRADYLVEQRRYYESVR